MRAIGKAYVGILKKETDWKYAEDNGKKFSSELKTFIELSVLNAVPYIGACALAWEYAYPGATLEEII